MQTYDHIYKRDTRGNLRVWFMQRDGERYRTVAGIHEGSLVESDWTVAQATNVGRSNERDPVAQAEFEVAAAYEHKLTREYHRTIEATDGGAHFFKPMLAKEFEAKKFVAGFAQPKLDGMRCIATADGLWSRQGKPITSCAHIEAALKPLFDGDPDLILDGELYNHDLKADFGKLMSLCKKASPTPAQAAEIAAKVQYHVYDAPSVEGPFFDRILHVARAIAVVGGPIIRVETREGASTVQYDQLHVNWIQQGYEGSIFRLNAPYEQKRSKHLLKRKDFDENEFDVAAIEEGEGNWSGAAKRVICWLPGADRSKGITDETTFGCGIRGTYEDMAQLLIDSRADLERDGAIHQVVSVRHFGWTDTAIPKPRFGVVTKIWGAARTL